MTLRYTTTILLATILALVTAIGFSVARPEAAEAANTVKVTGCTGTSVTLATTEKAMLVKHNRVRADRGLKKLCIHPALQRAAKKHSQDMIDRDYFSHNSKDGSTFAQRIKREGYKYRYAGENIAYGSGSLGAPDNIFKNWMNSSGHRTNILNKNFREVGIGAATGTYKSYSNTTMWTADFGTR